MNHTNVNGVARILVAKILTVFPGWESTIHRYGPKGDWSNNEPDLTIMTVTPPAQPTHRLDVVLRGNSVEVRYDDSRPPGPAEKLFVDFDREPEAASDVVVAFLRDLTEGHVVIARRPLGLLVRFMRGGHCQSLAEFRSAREIAAADVEGYTAVYKWVD
jgi:hypothetical protein